MRSTRRNRNRRGTRQQRNATPRRGGSKIYTRNGNIKNLNEKFEELNFFRKEFSSPGEVAIARLIQQHPHPNIVKVYRVSDSSIDIEEVRPFGVGGAPRYDKKTLIAAMTKAKDHLQSLGVMYIDWKPDNIGLASDGNYKLYDFDASGVTKPNKKNWSIKPPEWWKYGQAIASGIEDPVEMNNFAFDIGLVRDNYKPVSTQ